MPRYLLAKDYPVLTLHPEQLMLQRTASVYTPATPHELAIWWKSVSYRRRARRVLKNIPSTYRQQDVLLADIVRLDDVNSAVVGRGAQQPLNLTRHVGNGRFLSATEERTEEFRYQVWTRFSYCQRAVVQQPKRESSQQRVLPGDTIFGVPYLRPYRTHV